MEAPDKHLQEQPVPEDTEQQHQQQQKLEHQRQQQQKTLQQQLTIPGTQPVEPFSAVSTAGGVHHLRQQRRGPQQQCQQQSMPQQHSDQEGKKEEEGTPQKQPQEYQSPLMIEPVEEHVLKFIPGASREASQQQQQRNFIKEQLEQAKQQHEGRLQRHHIADKVQQLLQTAVASESASMVAPPSIGVEADHPATAANAATAGTTRATAAARSPAHSSSPQTAACATEVEANTAGEVTEGRRLSPAPTTAPPETAAAPAAASPHNLSPPSQNSDSLWRPQPSPQEEAALQQQQQQRAHKPPPQQQEQEQEERAALRAVSSPRVARASSPSDPSSSSSASLSATTAANKQPAHSQLNSAFVRSPAERRRQQQQQHRHAAPQRANLSLVAPVPSSSKAAAANSLLLQGWLQKWTNLLSSWRPRYFFVYAGFFKYSTTKTSPPKEMFLLNQCRIRLCPHDPVRFEVDVIDQQTLYLRADSQEEKQMWYAAFKQGQRAALSGTHRAGRSATAAAAGGNQRDRHQQQQQQQRRKAFGDTSAAAGPSAAPSTTSSSVKRPDKQQQRQQYEASSAAADKPTATPAGAPGAAADGGAGVSPPASATSSNTSSGGALSGLAGVVASSAAAAAAFATSRLRSLSAAAVQQPPPPPAALPPPPPLQPQQQQQQKQLLHQQLQQESGTLRSRSDGGSAAETTADMVGAAASTGAPTEAPAGSSSSSSSPLLGAQLLQADNSSEALLENAEGPLVLLLESIINARQNIQEACSKMLALQADLLKSVAQITQTSPGEGGGLRSQVVLLLQRVDELQQLLQQLLQQWERLLSEEYAQRRQLEKSVRSLAKRNYKLDKAQERLLQLSRQRGKLTAAEVAVAITGVRLPDMEGDETATAAAAAAAAAAQEGASFSTSDSDDEAHESLEFFDCDDELADDGMVESLGLPDPQKQQQQQQAESREGASGASASEPGSRQSSGGSNNNFIGPVFSPAANAAATLAAASPHIGGATPGQRLALPKPRTEFKVNLWSVLKDCIGRDLSRIAMPVYFNEPTSFLQRQCEDLQYCELLNLSCRFPRSVDRLLGLTLYALSPYASAVGRTYKPFNPLLGETFELKHKGFRFLSEQVGHHPPITAYVATASEFSCEGWVTVRNRFSGKSLEVTMPGVARVKLHRTGERFSYKRTKMLIHNVIWGKLWIEVDGTSLVENETSGDFSVVQFLRKGWLDKTCHHLRAIVFEASGRPAYRLSGQWSSALYVEEAPAFPDHKKWKIPPQVEEYRRSETGPPADSPDNQLDAVVSQYWESIAWVESSRRLIWRPTARPPNADQFYGFGYFTMDLNNLSPDYAAHAAPTDSRRRPDQRLYEAGRVDEAVEQKNRLEEKQREAARARPRGECDYQPCWFERQQNSEDWVYKGGYWEAREEGQWGCCPDIF